MPAKIVFSRPGNCAARTTANDAPASDFVRRCTENTTAKYGTSPSYYYYYYYYYYYHYYYFTATIAFTSTSASASTFTSTTLTAL